MLFIMKDEFLDKEIINKFINNSYVFLDDEKLLDKCPIELQNMGHLIFKYSGVTQSLGDSSLYFMTYKNHPKIKFLIFHLENNNGYNIYKTEIYNDYIAAFEKYINITFRYAGYKTKRKFMSAITAGIKDYYISEEINKAISLSPSEPPDSSDWHTSDDFKL